ncbi:sugar ABC transporter ATP-binding protein [Shimazuella soli]|uniref:sugar ABC transporter ATP-binding protein n=1 Tax=Shimazuella soli TaxID=1892854 RepID=UPI001F0FCE24|nr:sugar ABC transporter ATP-binding protein [Shimazuella soli]
MKRIVKSFHENKVLKEVDFTVQKGEIHALLGVNGAGKSTLVKILSGQLQSDSGEIKIGERLVSLSSPHQAIDAGIGIVVQEVDTALFPELTVAENVSIHELVQGPAFFSRRERKKRAKEWLERVGLNISMDRLVSECRLSEKQQIVIAQALARNVQFLILDEPTAPLSEVETKALFQLMIRLKDSGVGIVFISHRLPEIRAICDRVTVLREGRTVLQSEVSELTDDQIVEAMLGKQLLAIQEKSPRQSTTPLLEVQQFYVPKLDKSVTFTLHEGEVLGIAGLVGSGKTEIARALAGQDKSSSLVTIRAKHWKIKHPRKAIEAGICLIPEERRKEGVLVDFPVDQNISLPHLDKITQAGWLDRRKERQLAEKVIEQLSIRTSSSKQSVGLLSGGNQQKVSIGRWLDTDASIYLFDEPTKGIDIGAKVDVFSIISKLAEEKKGILYFTSELNELLTIADRILVLYDGRFIAEKRTNETTLEELMTLATGGNPDGTEHRGSECP